MARGIPEQTPGLERPNYPVDGYDPGGDAGQFRPGYFEGSKPYDPIQPMDSGGEMPNLPYDLGLDNLPGISGVQLYNESRNKMEDALYRSQTSRLDPQFEQREKQIRDMLVNRGLTEGSEIWNQEMGNLTRGRNDAYSQARDQSYFGAGDAMQQQLNMELARRNQPLQERLAQFGASSQARGQLFGEDTTKYNQLASILGLTPSPSAGGDLGSFWGPSPVDMMSGFQNQMQAQMHNQPYGGDILSGLLGLGGQLGGAYLGR